MAPLLKLSLLLGLACLASAQDKSVEHEIVNPFICTPGTSFKIDCNYCHCNAGNRIDCTLMACNLGPDDCIPGTVFEMGGYYCRCPDCGFKWHSDCFAGNYCHK